MNAKDCNMLFNFVLEPDPWFEHNRPEAGGADDHDAILRELHGLARLVAAGEPLLAQHMHRLILGQESLGRLLASVLARQLGCAEMLDADMHDMMADIFCAHGEILRQAVDDMNAVKERDPACPDLLHVVLNLKGFHALLAYRVAHRLWLQERRELAYAIANLASQRFAVDIHPAACIGSGVMLDHGTGIVIGETAVVDNNVSILQNVTLGGTGKESGDRHPKVRSGVLIGAGAKILGNIEIGAMSKVAAGSVVLKEVPPHCTVAGVPAKVVRWHDSKDFPALDMRQSI